MKKLCRLLKKQSNPHGFSLVELLIVIAIMGVLAVIAFNAFNAVLVNSKKRADEQQAVIIEKAIRLLMTDTGKFELAKLIGERKTFYTTAASAGVVPVTTDNNIIGTENDKAEIVKLFIKALQAPIYVKNIQGTVVNYGPYLTPSAGLPPSYEHFKPKADTENGGNHVGYNIKIYPKTQNVSVVPVMSSGEVSITDFN